MNGPLVKWLMEWRRWIVGVYWKKMPSLSELQSAQRSANLFQEILTLIVMRFYSVPVFWIKVQRQRNWNHPIQCIRNSRLPKINVQLVVRMTFSPRVAHFRVCPQFWICAALEIFIQRNKKKHFCHNFKCQSTCASSYAFPKPPDSGRRRRSCRRHIGSA